MDSKRLKQTIITFVVLIVVFGGIIGTLTYMNSVAMDKFYNAPSSTATPEPAKENITW